MSVVSQQQDDIASELSTAFENHPVISVEALGSTDSDEFQIIFRCPGLVTDENEDVKESYLHTIKLTIPFGFPLFSPSCKPLSPIFHPDFDSDAIYLGDFWNQDRTCTELVEFIGKMITGQIYSKENAFNEKAASWYTTHADKLPLTGESEPFPQEGLSEEQLDCELDTVKEEDFSTDFDYLSLESTELAIDKPSEPFNKSDEYDLIILQERLSQKRFQQLDRELNAIPASTHFKERDSWRKQTDEALLASQNLQKQAQQSETAGDLPRALAIYKKAQSTVTDLYGVEKTIQRIQQAIELGPVKPLQDHTDEEARDKTEKEKPVVKQKGSKSHIKFSARYFLIVPIIAILFFGFQFFTSNRQVQNTRSLYHQCTNALEKKEFMMAQDSCEQAYQESLSVGFFYATEMQQLATQAKKILDSEELTQGLVGKILVNGVWIYQNETIRISPFKTLMSKALELVEERKWLDAEKTLRQASPLANTAFEKESVQDLIKTVDFYKMEEDAFAAYEQKGCKDGVDFLLEAQQKAALLPIAIRKQHLPEISYKLTECTFQKLVSEGNKLYEQEDWLLALHTYRDALEKIINSPFPERRPLADIKNKMNKAELYAAMDSGNSSFTSGDWDEAINQFQQAVALIDNTPSLSDEDVSQFNRSKLLKIILQAKIIKGKQLAQKAIKDNQFMVGIARYQHIKQIIQSTTFATEDNFVKMIASIDNKILSLEKLALIEKQRQYLQINFADLFVKHYPGATENSLVSPIIVFVSEDSENFIYKMQATEIGGGRPLSLVMYYAYHRPSKIWRFTQAPK